MNEINILMNNTIILIPNWKWIALGLGLLAGILLRPLLMSVTRAIKGNQKLRSLHPFIKLFLDEKIDLALGWILVTIFWHGILGAIDLPTKMDHIFTNMNMAIQYFFLIRLTYLGAQAFGDWLSSILQKNNGSLNDQLAPLATKTLKVFVVIFGALMALQNFGFNVMSLLAGLGLGGLALALAAQDTAANLFGSITIILDRPFQVGDWVKVGDTEGTVEEIGFRSTRIRSFYQSLISVPNSVMAKERIDNMGARPYRRIRHNLGVSYNSSNLQLQQFMESVRYALLQKPEVIKEDIRVYLTQLADNSMQILVQVFARVEGSHDEFQLQEDILLTIKESAEKTGVSFIYPSPTIALSPEATRLLQK